MAPEGKQGPLIDVGTGILRRDHVLVQHGPLAVVVLATGPRAEMLRRFACAETADEDDPFSNRCLEVAEAVEGGQIAKARQNGISRAILKMKDRTLRRLAIAEELAKAGFNPDEPRDARGRWTSDGGGVQDGPPDDRRLVEGRSSSTDAPVARASSAPEWSFAGDVAPEALTALGQLSARFTTAGAVLGVYFFAIKGAYLTRGVVPGRPNISWVYDAYARTLTLSRDGQVLVSGENEYGQIRNAVGRVIGRFVNGNIAFDAGVLSAAVATADSSDRSRSGAQPVAVDEASGDRPKLCPDPSFEPSSRGWSNEAGGYQMQITGLPWGLGVELNDVVFDGCRETDGTMKEAKAFYLHFKLESNPWIWDFKIEPEIMDQAKRQSAAAQVSGRQAEWYFAEQELADFFRERFDERGFSNIKVFHRPYVPGKYKPEEPQ